MNWFNNIKMIYKFCSVFGDHSDVDHCWRGRILGINQCPSIGGQDL
jgi:hypothetical protein